VENPSASYNGIQIKPRSSSEIITVLAPLPCGQYFPAEIEKCAVCQLFYRTEQLILPTFFSFFLNCLSAYRPLFTNISEDVSQNPVMRIFFINVATV